VNPPWTDNNWKILLLLFKTGLNFYSLWMTIPLIKQFLCQNQHFCFSCCLLWAFNSVHKLPSSVTVLNQVLKSVTQTDSSPDWCSYLRRHLSDRAPRSLIHWCFVLCFGNSTAICCCLYICCYLLWCLCSGRTHKHKDNIVHKRQAVTSSIALPHMYAVLLLWRLNRSV
jgi:hypothetical protein